MGFLNRLTAFLLVFSLSAAAPTRALATTPLMSLDLPQPGVTLGPTWAAMLNTAFERVDSHNHTTGNGAKVPVAGLLMNADLGFGGFNATNLNSVRLLNQGSVLSGLSDVRSLYVVGGDLYYNNASGTAVKLTSGSSLNLSSLGVIGGDYGGSNPASVTFSESLSSYSFLESAGKVAEMNFGPFTVFDETVGALGITIRSPSGIGAAYTLTLPTAQAAANNVMKANGSGQLSFGQVQTAEIADSAVTTQKVNDAAVTTPKIADANVTTAKLADASVQTAKLADSGVTTAKVNDAAVTTAKIADGAVTSAKIAQNVNIGGNNVQENGLNVVVSRANDSLSLAMLRGRVEADGTINIGTGFSVNHLGTGQYGITYTGAFYDAAMLVCATSSNYFHCSVHSENPGDAEVWVTQSSGGVEIFTDSEFRFIAVGQR